MVMDMGMSFTFSMCSIFYSLLLTISFFTKKKIMSIENKIYGYLIVCNLIGTLIGTFCYYTIQNRFYYPVLNEIVSKGIIIYFLSWISLFTIYVFIISYNKKSTNDQQYKLFYQKLVKIFGFIYLICAIIIIILPLDYYSDNGIVYSYGPSASFMYLAFVGFVISFFCAMCASKNKWKNTKFIPVIVFSVLGIIVAVIQKLNPGLLLMTAMETFITFLMYFTIENPDVNMLNELYKNKELMEQNYEDKYNFLFEMTGEARNPLININSLCSELRDEENPNKIKNGLMEINNMAKQLDFSINNILNISSLDIQKIKIVDSKYDLVKICDDLILRIKSEVKPNVEFNVDIPKQVPILYGDYIKIRQILYSLLINSCKNTINGNIHLKINLIEKYDVCRVIINISDTGCGMPIDKINELMSATGELEKDEIDNLQAKEYNIKVCQKVTKIMGGNLIIKSVVGKGTDVIMTIDQRVYHEKDESILAQYENDIVNYKKVLIVSQNKEVNNTIKKVLNNHKITYSHLYYGMDAIDKIKSGKKYDFILIEDEMKEMSGFMTLQGMKKIKDFDIPAIIMLNKDKENIRKHFLEDGFNDCILIDNIETELERIIEKY